MKKDARLDAILPPIKAAADELHLKAAVLETGDAAQLIELAMDGKIRRYLLGRLSDTVALVDPGKAEALGEALRAGGHTPKIVEGEAE